MITSGKRVYLSDRDVEQISIYCDVSEDTIHSLKTREQLLEFLLYYYHDESAESEMALLRRIFIPKILQQLGVSADFYEN